MNWHPCGSVRPREVILGDTSEGRSHQRTGNGTAVFGPHHGMARDAGELGELGLGDAKSNAQLDY